MKKSSRSYAALYQVVDKLRLVLLLIDDGRCFRRDAYTQHDLSVVLRAATAWASAATLLLLFHQNSEAIVLTNDGLFHFQ